MFDTVKKWNKEDGMGGKPGVGENNLQCLALFVYLDHPTKNDVTSSKKSGLNGKIKLNMA